MWELLSWRGVPWGFQHALLGLACSPCCSWFLQELHLGSCNGPFALPAGPAVLVNASQCVMQGLT